MISKIKISISFLVFFASLSFNSIAQTASIKGIIQSASKSLEFVSVQIKETNFHAISDENGNFLLDSLPSGFFKIRFHSLGFKDQIKEVQLTEGKNLTLNINLEEDRLNLNEIVISGTRYELDKKESPVIVNVLNPRTLEATQSMTISEGLNFQPGVRVETNCQNCGFTQVRLNGLEGAYSQILVNSRAVFSALNSVYGLDQIPSNIVERIEIVRGGGSALYGSNAIAGTINIITREPIFDAFQISSNSALINGEKLDQTFNFNISQLNENANAGFTLYGMQKDREAFDANSDGFSEITSLKSSVIGAKGFIRTGEQSKINVDLSYLNEKRRGGDRLEIDPHLTDIAERLKHNTLFYGLNFEQFLGKGEKKHKFSIYNSGQVTERDSYYGGLGGGRTSSDSILALNAYGKTSDLSNVLGIQYTHSLDSRNTLTMGIENQYNEVKDQILGYQRLIDQKVNSIGTYFQHEWKVNSKIKVLSGLRYDISEVKGLYELDTIRRTSKRNIGALSPRLTMLYKILPQVQLRAGYARGFRAPQAFNEDLHISSVAGEANFVILSEDLRKETSDSYTASVNYTTINSKSQLSLLFEGFYTVLKDPFTTVNNGLILSNGSIVEEVTNGEDATVHGLNIELNISPHRKFRFENGFTLQRSFYASPQILFEDSNEKTATTLFTRSPNLYGYSSFNWSVSEVFSLDFTNTYTGEMIVPKVISDNGNIKLRQSNPFLDSNVKLAYHFDLKAGLVLEFSTGVQNLFNSYQNDFDIGPQRDSDYVYGPSRPRTFFFGIKLGNYH